MAQRGATKHAAPGAAPANLDEVKRTLRRLIEKNAGIPAGEIDDESTVDGDLAMDSMSFLGLQVAMEETFGINCTPEEIEAANRFAAIAVLVQERATRARAGGVAGSPRAGRIPAPKRAARSGRRGVVTSSRSRH